MTQKQALGQPNGSLGYPPTRSGLELISEAYRAVFVFCGAVL